MSTIPPSSGVPYPPPPRPASTVVAIAVLVLLLILIVSGAVLYIGARYLARSVKVGVDKPGGKQVTIETPVGSLEVNKGLKEVSLGLPIYPGAKKIEGKDSARVNIEIPGAASVHVVAAEFETPDPLDKVKEFYRERLKGELTKYTERTAGGSTVFEIKREGLEQVVSLKSTACCTRIKLARVSVGKDEAN